MANHIKRFLTVSLLAAWSGFVSAETIRVAIGTQDTTINCATGGLIVRELNLLEKYLPTTGKYKDVKYEIEWKNFTSGAPLTNEMVAGKLDFGAMADFPGSFNGVAHHNVGKGSLLIAPISGSILGAGNGIVVPAVSSAQSLADLKGKTISVPFASTAHGVLLRAIDDLGWDAEKDVTIISQAPEIAGAALRANRIAGHANFVPFPDLFANRGFGRKILDGSETRSPTFHGSLVNEDYAKKYPEIVVALLRAGLEADQLVRESPEKYSLLIEKVTGIDAEVNYLFHGPLGLQTRDATWKPEYREATVTAIKTLEKLKKTKLDLNVDKFIDDIYIKRAFKAQGLDYAAALKNYDQVPLRASDSTTGKTITNFRLVAQIWVRGEDKVRAYASPDEAFKALKTLEANGKDIRAIYAQAYDTGIKLLANQAWYVRDKSGLKAFLLNQHAEQYSRDHDGQVLDFTAARS